MTGRVLIAVAGSERIALILEQVAEVLEYTVSFPLPLAPPWLNRFISAKGSLIPVLDVALFLGKPATGAQGRILVMAGDGVNLALHVDLVSDSVSADAIHGEKPCTTDPFTALLNLPCGETPLLSLGQLLAMLERSLAEKGEQGGGMKLPEGVPAWT